MHLRSVLAVAVVVLAPAARAQWVQQSPLPHGLLLHDVAAPTPDVAFLASDDAEADDPRGGLFRTTDGGRTWADVPLPPQFGLYDVFFLDPQHGWAVGDENYRTVDGGQTWQQTMQLGSTYSVEFYTPLFGLASGNFGLAVSRDGGLTWGFSPNNASAFSFRDGQVGLAASPGGIRRTTSGGQSFTVVRSGAAEDVEFLTPDVAIGIVGGQLVRSSDGGATWTDRAAAQGRTALLQLSDDVALAFTFAFITGDALVLRTADGGQSWASLGNVVPGGIERIDVVDAQTVVAVTPTGNVWRSGDAGQTWSLVLNPPTVSVLDWGLDFSGPHGWLAAGSGLVMESHDGGLTWRQNSNGYGDYITDVDRFDDGRLIAATGHVLLSEDGARWTLVEEAEQDYANVAVQVVDGTYAVLLENEGLVRRSADGGRTWTSGGPIPATSFTASDFGDVHFRTRTDGWVVGRDLQPPYDRNVWHTTDAGQTWVRPALPQTGGDVFSAVDFEGERGWIASGIQAGSGIGARYLRTFDGGATWVSENLPNSYPVNINDLEFFDEDTGYAVGSLGYAARSTDGGRTWTVLPVPAPTSGPDHTYTLFDLYLTSPTDVWAATTQDVVLHSTNGGQSWEVLRVVARPESFGSFTGIVASGTGQAWTVGFGGHIYAMGVTSVAGEPAAPAAPPATFALSGPDPNPASGRVAFALTLAAPEAVRVEAFDALGRRVAVLHDGPLAAGPHALTFDASALPAGVYVVRAEVSGRVSTTRLVVAR
ncbi:MAG TPA: YCF48-related protein [Rubricoccaceae bacterium]